MHFVTWAIYCRAPFDVSMFDTKEVFKLYYYHPTLPHHLFLFFFFCIPKPFKAHSSGTWANFICINNKYYSYAALHGAQLPPSDFSSLSASAAAAAAASGCVATLKGIKNYEKSCRAIDIHLNFPPSHTQHENSNQHFYKSHARRQIYSCVAGKCWTSDGAGDEFMNLRHVSIECGLRPASGSDNFALCQDKLSLAV